MLRSLVAVLVGYLTMMLGVTTFFAFVVFVLLGGHPEDPHAFEPPRWLYVLELVTAPVFAGLGGYVCAWIARRKVMHHALALVCVVAIAGVVSIVGEAGMKPMWETIAVVVLGCAGVPLGARLRLVHERAVA